MGDIIKGDFVKIHWKGNCIELELSVWDRIKGDIDFTKEYEYDTYTKAWDNYNIFSFGKIDIKDGEKRLRTYNKKEVIRLICYYQVLFYKNKMLDDDRNGILIFSNSENILARFENFQREMKKK